jgi:histidinol dehydrogenase
MLKTIYYPAPSAWKDLCKRPTLNTAELDQLMQEIFDQTLLFGDHAIRHFTKIFESREVDSFFVSPEDIKSAGEGLSLELKQAIAYAAKNIQTFHSVYSKGTEVIETTPGVRCWSKKYQSKKLVYIFLVGLHHFFLQF